MAPGSTTVSTYHTVCGCGVVSSRWSAVPSWTRAAVTGTASSRPVGRPQARRCRIGTPKGSWPLGPFRPGRAGAAPARERAVCTPGPRRRRLPGHLLPPSARGHRRPGRPGEAPDPPRSFTLSGRGDDTRGPGRDPDRVRPRCRKSVRTATTRGSSVATRRLGATRSPGCFGRPRCGRPTPNRAQPPTSPWPASSPCPRAVTRADTCPCGTGPLSGPAADRARHRGGVGAVV